MVIQSGSLYPREFPDAARDAVEAERIKAGLAFDRERATRTRSYGSLSAEIEPLFFKYVLRVFLVFATEACKLGWTIDKVRTACDTFLRRFTLEVGYEWAPSLEIRFTNINGTFLTQRVDRKLRRSSQWKKFEELLLRTAGARRKVSQAAIQREGSQSTDLVETPSQTAASDSRETIKAQSVPVAIGDTTADLKAQRLAKMTASKLRWETPKLPFMWIHKAAGVDHHDAYDWKNGKLSAAVSIRMDRVLDSPTPPAKPKESGRSH